MTNQEIINRLGSLDIRDAEKEDYAALYLAIELIKGISSEHITEEKDENGN